MTALAPPTSQKAELLVSCLPPNNTFFFFAVLPGQSGASLPLQLRVSTCCRSCCACVCARVCACVWLVLERAGCVTELHQSVPSTARRNLGPCICALESTIVPESSASKPDPLGCPGWVGGGSVECLLSTCEALGLILNTIKKKINSLLLKWG